MPEIDASEKRKEEDNFLQKKFDFEKHGFYDVTLFTDNEIGFSFKKDFGSDKEHVSLFHLLIPKKGYIDTTITRKPLLITAVYGKKTDGGVTMRALDTSKLLDEPLDLNFTDEYFYDFKDHQLYRGKEKITGDQLLEEIYWKHIKCTKPIMGIILRLKLRFWRTWLVWILSMISKFFHYFLLIISGDRYKYEFVLQEETLNGVIISSRFDRRIGRGGTNQLPKPKEDDKEAKKIDFFGIDVPQWPIVFYAILHLSILGVWKYLHYSTIEIKKFFDNNFLTVLYVIVSFWLVETVLPFCLKKLIKLFSTLSALSEYKNIKV